MDESLAFLVISSVVTFTLLTVLLVVVDVAAARGRLRRNQFVGIRTPSTMRSDRAWVAGHRAALRLTPLHVLTGVALVVAVLHAKTAAVANLIGMGGALAFIVVAVVTAVVAGRAAKKAEGLGR